MTKASRMRKHRRMQDAFNKRAQWRIQSVSHAKRRSVVRGVEQEIDVTVVMMRDPRSGHLKTWETVGTFTLEQLTQPEAICPRVIVGEGNGDSLSTKEATP